MRPQKFIVDRQSSKIRESSGKQKGLKYCMAGLEIYFVYALGYSQPSRTV